MDDFDRTYQIRHEAFQKGEENGKKDADNDALEDIVAEAILFGKDFAEEFGTYEAYLQTYEQLEISQKLPLLKVNDVVEEMKKLIKEIDYSSLELLRQQRQSLRRSFQIFKAMVGAKGASESKKSSGIDF